MTITETIRQHVQKLPASLQTEVLDFVEYLLVRTERRETKDWSDLSLAFAMRGMEDEDMPTYTTADLKMIFA
jgi:hypothetical protein